MWFYANGHPWGPPQTITHIQQPPSRSTYEERCGLTMGLTCVVHIRFRILTLCQKWLNTLSKHFYNVRQNIGKHTKRKQQQIKSNWKHVNIGNNLNKYKKNTKINKTNTHTKSWQTKTNKKMSTKSNRKHITKGNKRQI